MAVARAPVGARADKPVVLMGFAEAMAAIETAWSLRDAGFSVVGFRRDGSRPALRRVRGVRLHAVPRPEEDATATVRAVRDLLAAVRPAALLPLDDHALWVMSRLGDVGAALAGAEGLAADVALDKSRQLEIAAQAGLTVPATQVLTDLADAGPVGFPVIVKPARALYEVGRTLRRPAGVVCADPEELARAESKPWPGTVLVQPLIQGTGEGLFGHVGSRGVTGWTAHRRVRMVNPQGSASSACRSHPVDPRLVEPSERFLRAIGWRGMFMLEFLRDADGTPWFMELNGRAWGSMALARRRGFEYPAWTVRAALDPGFEPAPPARPPEVRCRNVGLEIVHLAFVARGPQSAAPVPWPRLGRELRDVCGFAPGDRLYNWNRREPAVLFADAWGTLRPYLRKVVRKPR